MPTAAQLIREPHATAPTPTFGSAPGAALWKALIAAQRHAQAVGKASTNTFHHYKYASAEAIIEEARDALTHAGVMVATVGWQSAGDRMVVTYLIAHESGETLVAESSTPIVPDKGRPLDKAEATALTANLGYFLRGLLLLPRVDQHEEMNNRDDRGAERSGRGRTFTVPSRSPRPPAPEPAPPEQALQPKDELVAADVLARIRTLLASMPDIEAVVLARANVARLEDLPAAKGPRVVEWLQSRASTARAADTPQASPRSPLATLADALEGATDRPAAKGNGTSRAGRS